MEKSKKRGVLLRVLSISAIAAITAGVIGAGTMARYSSQFGADGLEGDGHDGYPARAAAFHFVGSYQKDGTGDFTDATGHISLFSSMYKSSTGRGTGTDSDDVTVKASQQVVAPGTNGALSLKMEAGTNATVDTKCYAETDTIVKLDVKQLEYGVYTDKSDGSHIPIIYKLNNKYYVSKDSNLEPGNTYVFHNNGGVGGFTKDPTGNTVITIDGYLEDMAEDSAYYYKAKDKFYKMQLGTDDKLTYTASDKNFIVDADTTTPAKDGITELKFDLDWIWNYQNLGDITDYVNTYLAEPTNAGKTTADAIAAFNGESAAKKAEYLTEASAHANDVWDTLLGEAAYQRAKQAAAGGGTGAPIVIGDDIGTGTGTGTDIDLGKGSDIQLSVRVDATQVD